MACIRGMKRGSQHVKYLCAEFLPVGGRGYSSKKLFTLTEPVEISSLPGIEAPVFVQGFQSTKHEFEKLKIRNLDRSGEESDVCTKESIPCESVEDPDNNCYQPMSNVSLYSVMQSNVPNPCDSTPSNLNMPFGGIGLGNKFTYSEVYNSHPLNNSKSGKRSFSTLSNRYLMSNKANEKTPYSYGVSGEDMQGVQGSYKWVWPQNHTLESLSKLENPCPQGIQGSECDKFTLWLSNCTKYNFVNCESQLADLKEGRKTLGEIFEEQEREIRKVASDFKNGELDAKVGIKSDTVNNNDQDRISGESVDVKVSQKDRLKKAVSQYGSTVIVFHVGISLISLGGFYVAVSRLVFKHNN